MIHARIFYNFGPCVNLNKVALSLIKQNGATIKTKGGTVVQIVKAQLTPKYAYF
jgi:hypothetical protein